MLQPIEQPANLPVIDLNLPRNKPAAAMGLLIPFPMVAKDINTLPPEQQAAIVVLNWGEAAKAYATCSTSRDILIDWINE